MELPLWQLENSQVRAIDFKVHIPEIYQDAYTEICKADANAVNLGRLNKYFYELGRYIVRFDRHNAVAKLLHDTCRERAVYLKDLCNNLNNESRQDLRLENLEHQLFELGCRTNREFSNWLVEDSSNIKVADIVENHRKRKRAIMELDGSSNQSPN
jgi:GINS complex subunit 3